MAHLHPPVNFPHPGSPTALSGHPNAFPSMPISEPTSQAPLDLNFSQKAAQNPAKVESETVQQKEPEHTSNPPQEVTPNIGPEGTTLNGGLESPSKRTPKAAARAAASQKSRCHWTHGEIIALFDAKKAQAERADFGSTRKLRSPTAGKWDDVADFCKSMGVKKQPSQCRDKWERLWPTFKKILDWERQLPEGKSSYWTMTEDERDREGFPRVLDKEIYDAMYARFAFITPHNMSALAVNSPPLEDSEAANTEGMHNGNAIPEDGPSVVDDHTPVTTGRKRKNPPRSCTMKKSASDSKKTCLGLQSNEDTPSARNSKDGQSSKGKLLDPEERKAALDERKLKLEERRFALEEKKLEATMEIGKGLIASMERMTSMISSLGAHAVLR